MRPSRFFLWAMAVTIALMIAGTIITWYLPLLVPFEWQMIVAVGLLVLVYLVSGLVCAAAAERGRAPRLMWSGIITGAIALAGWLTILGFINLLRGMWAQKMLIWPTAWAGFVVLLGLALLPRVHGLGPRVARGIAIALAAGLALSVAGAVALYPDYNTFALWTAEEKYDMIIARIIGVFSILTAAAYVLFFLSIWMHRLHGKVTPVTAAIPFWFECPRCGAAQDGVTGECCCHSCGLRVKVHLT